MKPRLCLTLQHIGYFLCQIGWSMPANNQVVVSSWRQSSLLPARTESVTMLLMLWMKMLLNKVIEKEMLILVILFCLIVPKCKWKLWSYILICYQTNFSLINAYDFHVVICLCNIKLLPLRIKGGKMNSTKRTQIHTQWGRSVILYVHMCKVTYTKIEWSSLNVKDLFWVVKN